MNNQTVLDMTRSPVDSQALANLILELNISRRNSRSYPKGHQVIDAALNKVLKSYAGLRETGEEIVIGVACNALLLGDAPLEKSNLIYRDFARVLYERGIGALVLRRGLDIKELRGFISILGAKREEIYAAGGIETVWEKSGISSIGIWPIRYDLFTATEQEKVTRGAQDAAAKGLWERFARGLVSGQLASDGIDESLLDPELLAEALNQHFSTLADPGPAAGRETGVSAELAYGKLAAFISKLSPGLRRQFLNSTFDIKKTKGESMAEGIIRQLSADVVIDTLADISQNQISVPPFVLGLLQQMSALGSPDQSQSASDMPDQELQEKMRTIFKEHAMEEFIPDSYQSKLHKMMSADQVPLLGLEGVHDLMDTFEVASMESKTSDILLMLLGLGDATEGGDAALGRNLNDICTFFLQTGDYPQLTRVLRQLGADTIPEQVRLDLQHPFVRREFLEEVLDGLNVWGKGKFDEIGDLIWEIGVPFIEPLLDRLARAQSMSERRYLMDRLLEYGSVAGPAIIGRLSDERWFFLRNLIGMIRTMELASSLEGLRPLARHSDPRVSQEALRALLEFRDPEAESQMVRDLEGRNREAQLAAVRIAGKAGCAASLDHLHALLALPGLSAKEYELKGVVVQALGEIGNPQTLPELERQLSARNFLHPLLLARLKQDIVATLGRYPAAAAGPLLGRLAQGGGNLAQQAALLMRGAAGRPS